VAGPKTFDELTAGVQITKGSLRDDVREHIRGAIISGVLAPGEKIAEARLARDLGLSQAPVREALRELEHAGLVTNIPRRGTFVRRITAQDAWEMYTLRAELEVMAAHLALPHLGAEAYQRLEELVEEMMAAADEQQEQLFVQRDVRFHEFICERSGHRLLLRTWCSINPLNWTAVTVTTLRRRDWHHLAARHGLIIEALRRGDQAEIGRVVREHVLTLGVEVARAFEEGEDQPAEVPTWRDPALLERLRA
jgi:DNA-binding GntR family transcriptional regulator